MIKATPQDKQTVIDILMSAFIPYTDKNSINLVVKQDHKREQRMRVLMAYLFDYAMLFGQVFLSENHDSCLLIKYKDREKTTLKTIFMELKLAFLCIGIARVFEVLKREKITKQYFPKSGYMSPMILAVTEEKKGRGPAARFMIEIKKHFRDNQIPVYIDTASEYNVKLYEKFGFKVFDQNNQLGFPLYFMRII